MKVWDITIEPDEQGWYLRVQAECDGGDCDFRFDLGTDAGEQLYRQVRREIGPWIAEMEEAKAAYQRGDDRWKPREVLANEAQDEIDAGVYDHDLAKRIDAYGRANA